MSPFLKKNHFFPNFAIQGKHDTHTHEFQNWDWSALIESSSSDTSLPNSVPCSQTPSPRSSSPMIYPKHLLLPVEEINVYTRRKRPLQLGQQNQETISGHNPGRTPTEEESSSQSANEKEVNGLKLIYLDNAATSQKPNAVLKALQKYYEAYNSNVHRGIHYLSAKATDEYELARKKVANFINAAESREIIFTRNATEAINLVAYSWGLLNLKPQDEVILTVAEHHSAIVPWQIVARKTGAILKFAKLDENEVPDIGKLRELISKKTKLVVVHHVSNVLATVLPIEEIVCWAHGVGTKVLVDACQSVPHMVVDVQALNADFLVASSHKMCGPTGVGFLYGKSDLLASMPPFLGGGEMIADVFLDHSTYADPPSRFEAGTPAIGEVIGLGAAVDYLSSIGMEKIHNYEVELGNYLYESLQSIPNIRIYGPKPSRRVGRAALCSFNIEDIHPTDIATILDQQHGVAIRSGHHCAQPLHRYFGVNASARASLYFYNTKEDVDDFIEALKDTVDFFNSFK